MTDLIQPSFHARLAASSAERWINCAGSVGLAEKQPTGPAPFVAAEGTYAHAIAAACLNTGSSPAAWLGKKAVVDGHEITCDQEMVDGVQVYLDTVDAVRLEQWTIELSLHEALKKLDPDFGGTADFATYGAARKLLRVVDFKYGAGTFVSADDNKQLKVYALGALHALHSPVHTVEVYIVQPRFEGAVPVRMESFAAYDLMDFAGELIAAAVKTRDPKAEFTAGPWCKKTFCPNARVCPALESMQHALIKQEFSSVIPFDPAALGQSLAAIPLVEERIAAIKSFAYELATTGVKIPGWKLVDKKPRRHWVDEPAVVKWAKDRAIDPYEAPAVKSPAQLEKGLKKAEKTELGKMAVAVSSGTTLVPESDARKEVTKMATLDDFDVVPQSILPTGEK